MRSAIAIAVTFLLSSCAAAAATDAAPSPASVPTVSEPSPATTFATPTTVAAAGVSFPAMVLASSAGEVALAGGGHGDVRTAGVISPSQRVVVSGKPSEAGTVVEWRDSRTAEVIASTSIAGTLRPVAVDATDKVVALIDGDPADHTRLSTTIVLADAVHGELRRWSFLAALVPEAFANFFTEEGSGLPGGVFTIEYLDASTYRVRIIDTASGELGLPLNLRDKVTAVDQVMTAVSRTAVFDPISQMLFTLYQGATENGEPEGAFIHTLGLFNGVWCLDVPEEIGLADHAGALAVSPDGRRLFAASGTGGVAGFVVADITNSSEMPAARTAVDLDELGVSPRVAIGASNDLVVMALGGRIWYLDPATLTVREQLTWDMDIEALTVLDDGSIVIVGARRMALISPDHQLLDEMPMPTPLGGGEVTLVAAVG